MKTILAGEVVNITEQITTETAPQLWKGLPKEILQSESIRTFIRLLKIISFYQHVIVAWLNWYLVTNQLRKILVCYYV